MLDNGGFQGKTVTPEKLIETFKQLKPELVVAPDVRFDSQKTLELHRGYAELADDKIMKKTIAVFRPEIKDMYHTLDVYQQLGYSIIGNPTGENYSEGYKQFWKEVREDYGFKIHILGAQDGTYNLLKDYYFDSIDIVSQDINEFKTIRNNIRAVELTKWRHIL
ncbi:MAG: hypothetical protein A4E26_00130 [Methanobacterium sp. PtaU1.Bin097]|nr:MAG: hypothetical protein A4E26_00130 [Methanobacterium sp. PtaU1.Bin097]